MKTSTLLKRFVPYYRNYVGIMIMDLFCAALTTVCELVLPLILRYITNLGMNDLSALTVQTIVTIGALYFVLRIIDGMASFYMAYTGHVMGASIETDMREDAFAHLQKLSDNYFNNTKVGQIMSRITSDLFDVTVMPVTGDVTYARGEEADPASGLWSYADRTQEIVRPGYYSVPLTRYGIRAELTATALLPGS